MHVASSSQGLDQGGSCSRLLSSLSALKALNISIATSTDRDSVLALVRPGGGGEGGGKRGRGE
jgi:hypothetical protein